jgi:hypothetical protein
VNQVAKEPLVTLSELAKRVPANRGAAHTHVSTLYRWISSGVRAPHGQIVRLEACRVGSKWCSSEAALQRFISALTPDSDLIPDPEQEIHPPRTPAMRKRASERAAEQLAQEAGI